MKQSYKTFFLWAVLILLFLSFYKLFNSHSTTETREMRASEFYADVERGDVASVIVKGNVLQGELKNHSKFQTVSPLDAQLLEKMRAKGVDLSFQTEDSNSIWAQLMVSWLPLAVLCVLFIFLMRQLQAGGGKAMSFGKSKAKLLSENHNKVSFLDVAGIDEAKDELEEIIQFLKDPKKFTKLGGRIPKGVLLMGAPGTGKTLLARAIAGEAGVPFFSISGSDFVEMFVGVGASRVRDLFEQGKKHAPCIIFIDEIDAVGRHRGAGLGGGHDEREQTLNQLLVEMDGFESNEGVILIAATNRPDVLDPALQRPGRFDRRIIVPRPDVKGREGILRVHTKKTPLSNDVDLDVISRGTPGFSGADLENLVNEAALLAARKNKERLDKSDFEHAKDKVMMGAERRSMIISDAEKRNTAWHEAGHTVVAKLLPNCDPVHKVTIIPRGPALGLTQTLPVEDRLSLYKPTVLDWIAMAMGGRIAEELKFNSMSTGAKNDIERATAYARSMVCEWGMSEKLGPLSFGEEQGEVFLGREFGQRSRNYSEATAIDIDAEVRRIVTEQYDRARKLLEENRDALDRIAQGLLEYETLDGEEVGVLMAGGTITRAKVVQPPRDGNKPKLEEKKDKSKILDALGGFASPMKPEPAARLERIAMKVRLIELQTEADSLLTCELLGRAVPDPNLRGWGALFPLEPAAFVDGLRQTGIPVLRGTLGCVALGSVSQLWSAGRSLADALKGAGKSLAVEMMLRAAAVEAATSRSGLGSSSGRMGDREPPGWVLARQALATGRTLVMGIINVTPDSFSDGGKTLTANSAIERGLQLAAEGVDIIDIGGESTRPGGAAVSAQEELDRIAPVVQRLARAANVPISIDTSKAEVARVALESGAEIVNDVSALAADPAMAPLIAERGCGLVLMHMRGTPEDMQSRADYRDLLGEVIGELDLALSRAREAGIADDHICIDPGYGFAKDTAHCFQLLRRQKELLQLGRPLLAGVSRKSFIGRAVGHAPGERLPGTLAAIALAVANGAAVVRVHDVAAARDAALVADAFRRDGAGLP